MRGIQQIFDSKKLVAIVFKNDIKAGGTTFITDPASPLQVGIHDANEKRELSTHKHGFLKPLKTIERHEVILVQTGCVKITFYSKEGKKLSLKSLNPGDGVLIMDVLHQVTLMPKTKIIEIKQGPYTPSK